MAKRRSSSSGGAIFIALLIGLGLLLIYPLVAAGLAILIVLGVLIYRETRPKMARLEPHLLEGVRDDAVLDIVGEASYQAALLKVAGGRTPDGPRRPDHRALLVPEPSNRYDPNAIRIEIDGLLVGYLSRTDAQSYQPVVRAATQKAQHLMADAVLTGGWDHGRRDQGFLGVKLHLGSPAECLLELVGDGLIVRKDHRWAGQLIAFTGDSTCRVNGILLDREASVALAGRAGLVVHPRVTKKVQLLVDCDPTGVSGNEAKALDYDIPVVDEISFWTELGVAPERLSWSELASGARSSAGRSSRNVIAGDDAEPRPTEA